MKTNFKNVNEVFEHAKCVFCNNDLKINVDAVTGYFKKDGNDLLSIDEENGEHLFTVDANNNQINFLNKTIKRKLKVFVVELYCFAHNYRQVYSFCINKSEVNKILLDEEDVYLTPSSLSQEQNKVYWVHNFYDENGEPFTEISSWDADSENPPPKSQFDLDVLEDLFATFKLETKWVKITPSVEKFQEKIENLIIFG